VARLMLYLMSEDESTGSGNVDLLTVHEFADIIGMTLQIASRVMAELKRNDITVPIDGTDPHLYRCDAAVLDREANA
jgi:CRP/FNR family transcriptional regulator, anaerobic regulatory protein